MNPKSTPRTTLTRIVTTMLMASALSATAAHAASFQYRHPVVGLVASPTSQAEQVVTEIVMALTGGPALPAGEVNWPYSYDLKQLLSVTGDSAYSASGVAWSLPSGALPAGLSLGSDGVISGTPTTKNLTGDSFQVLATYKAKTGQQVYTIVVNGAILHVTQISAGTYHTCAVTTSGGVKCWGYNSNGQLGNNSTTQSLVPVAVSGLTSGVASITGGGNHTCALTTSGGVKCWGFNAYGQMGNNSTTDSKVPVAVSGLTSGVTQIAVGNYHTCALTTSGGAKCWGFNAYGQMGNNSTTNSLVPVAVSGLTSGVASLAGGDNHTCAVTTAGGAKCWGLNYYGQLGNNSTANSNVPVDVSGLTSGVASLAGGNAHTCAVTTSGGVKCWGRNTAGQLGNNSTTQSLVPVAVSGLTSGVASITGGGNHTCALTTSGGVKCWGFNAYGQMGNNSTTDSKVPVAVSGLTSGVTQIAVGYLHTCAVTTAGGAKCWGNNGYGQMGNNSTANSNVPVDVSGLTSGVASLAVGNYHTCALTTSGGAKCWGRNYYGQLGNNSTTDSYVPVDLAP